MTLFFAVLPLLVLDGVHSDLYWQKWLSKWVFLSPWFLSLTTIIFSVLMICRIPLIALKFKHFRIKGNEMRFVFLTISAVLLATLFLWAVPLL